MKSRAFVQDSFGDYYARNPSPGGQLPMIDKREFGFVSFNGWMLRHKGFQSGEELISFLQDSVPRDCYVSGAYYEDPEAEMDKKGWLGADLVFDIDADHIPTPCGKTHDEWTCGGCGFAGIGITPEKCPACGSEKFATSTWPCEVCLASAKTETVKLLDMLMHDFGFSENYVRVFFSGHRGYHVHVESEAVTTLDSVARKEIVDYVSGTGLDTSLVGLARKKRGNLESLGSLRSHGFGWHRRLALGVQSLIANASDQELADADVGRKEIKVLLQNRDILLRSWTTKGALTIKGLGSETWRKLIERAAKSQSAKIDTVVTTDTHRLIRLADTLHSKTGFKKVEFPASTIGRFDPYESAIAFKEGSATVSVSSAPKFRLGQKMFGPYKSEKVDLPTAAAVLLVCKGRAEVVE